MIHLLGVALDLVSQRREIWRAVGVPAAVRVGVAKRLVAIAEPVGQADVAILSLSFLVKLDLANTVNLARVRVLYHDRDPPLCCDRRRLPPRSLAHQAIHFCLIVSFI